MEPIESSETSAYINTLTPGTYPKEEKKETTIKTRRKFKINKYKRILQHAFDYRLLITEQKMVTRRYEESHNTTGLLEVSY